MDTGNLIFLTSVIAVFLGIALSAWVAVTIGMKDRRMAAQIETANLKRAMRAMEEADDGRL